MIKPLPSETVMPAFPESSGTELELLEWHEETELARRLASLTIDETLDAESRLPYIIGYIPPSEREYFDELPDAEVRTDRKLVGRSAEGNWQSLDVVYGNAGNLPPALAETQSIIARDLKFLGSDDFVIDENSRLERTTSVPNVHGTDPKVHYDGAIYMNDPKHISSVIYVVTNNQPTLFYTGPVRWVQQQHMGLEYDSPSKIYPGPTIDPDKRLIAAPR
jgi:hypothetical protein